MRLSSLSMIVFCCLGLNACATPSTTAPTSDKAALENEARLQNEMAIAQRLKEEERVNRLAYPLLKSAGNLCPDKAYMAGLFPWNNHSLGPKNKDMAEQSFGLGENIQLRYVLEDSPAARAGLQKGDILVSINGETIPGGTGGFKKLRDLAKADTDADLDLVISRAGQTLPVTINRDYSCDYGVVYNDDGMEINAYADGKNIIIERGMYRFAPEDSELRLVIAHEIGHNAMGHIDKRKLNAVGAGTAGLALDILAAAAGVNTHGAFTNSAMDLGNSAYSQAFENEADYVGMYILANAGYDTSNAANFWRRMATEYNSAGIKNNGTHPTTPERFLAIDNTHREIMNKIASAEPLVPNMKD